MIEQYLNDKNQIFPNLRKDFIKSCLFLINKSDTLNEDKQSDIKNNIFNIMKEKEVNLKLSDLNISFYSGESVNYYMEIYNLYVDILKNKPLLFLETFFKEYYEYYKILCKKPLFKDYILSKINSIKEKLLNDSHDGDDNGDDDEDEDGDDNDNNNVPKVFMNELIEAFNKLNEKFNSPATKLSNEDKSEIIENLYGLSQLLQKKDFSKTKYSISFFDTLKNVIYHSEKLQKENFNMSLSDFFLNTDQLFQKELK